MMKNKDAKQLLEKYLAGDCTPEELLLIKRAYNKEIPEQVKEISEERYSEMGTNMWNQLRKSEQRGPTPKPLWPRIAAAAILLLTTGTAIYFFTSKNHLFSKESISIYANRSEERRVGKAILTLSNGKTIRLNAAKSGIVLKATQITYEDGTAIDQIQQKGTGISTISTPRGGKYQVELPDGTTVMLNAASTLKFPSTFSGSENRNVELTGEGYFQVAKDKRHPFIVKSGGQQVEVLGTHFNINSYPEEHDIKTTLVEGSVRVSSSTGGTLNRAEGITLKPGQQSILKGAVLQVSPADTESATAWKNGDFIFNEDIKTIMRQIERWYDVDVIYEGKTSEKEFLGTVSRSKSIIEILKALELTNRVHFKVEGRRITVMP